MKTVKDLRSWYGKSGDDDMRHISRPYLKILKSVFLFAMLVLMFRPSVTAEAATKKAAAASASKAKAGWVIKDGKYLYYRKGKKLRGLAKIGNRTYDFNEHGIQLTGWRQIGKSVYYFRIENGKKGYMITNAVVNGIRLKKNGKAAIKTEKDKRKVRLLVNYQLWAQKLTKRWMTKEQKLRTCFDYLRRQLRYRGSISLDIFKEDFDIEGAEFIYENGQFFECHTIACAFAYLANALGYSHVQICAHSGHGWTEIGGVIYDTSLARHNPYGYRYFATTDRDGQEWPKDVVKEL